MSERAPEQLQNFERGLLQAPPAVERVLADPDHFPPVPEDAQRIIRCSPENIELALCRALARCCEFGEFWRVEVAE